MSSSTASEKEKGPDASRGPSLDVNQVPQELVRYELRKRTVGRSYSIFATGRNRPAEIGYARPELHTLSPGSPVIAVARPERLMAYPVRGKSARGALARMGRRVGPLVSRHSVS